jgi:hypothetical protein
MPVINNVVGGGGGDSGSVAMTDASAVAAEFVFPRRSYNGRGTKLSSVGG